MSNPEEKINEDKSGSTFLWWESKRLQYNLGLIIAGAIAFVSYIIIIELFTLDIEITVFTIFFQAIGYLFVILLANICYFLGPIVESIIQPGNIDKYRKLAFQFGFWFSFLLPFAAPVLALIPDERIQPLWHKIGL